MDGPLTCPFAPQPQQPLPVQPPPLQVGMLLFPGLTLMDLVGPQTVLGWHGQTHLVWKTLDPVLADSGIAIQPTATFASCPADLDILFVPGGMGTAAVMEDAETLLFLADRGVRAGWVTSVCSGSLILAAAGLLRGHKATTHWAAYNGLAAMGVEVVRERVVADRNRMSGGGVTAGLDFGLALLARLRGEQVAKVTQLSMEYDPKPPFDCGTPDAAGPELTGIARAMMRDVDVQVMHAAMSARARLDLEAPVRPGGLISASVPWHGTAAQPASATQQ